MKILGISGALRKASTNTALLRAIGQTLPQKATLEIATLHGIPLYDGDAEAESGKPESVTSLNARIRAADGIIIATPEYNHSMPGVLKNATDWLSRGGSPFRWKRIGIVGAADGMLGAARAQLSLRQNMVGLEGIVMSKPDLFVGQSGKKFDSNGNLVDDETKHFIASWVKGYIDWVKVKP
jgi:chromate reductase, NAD(P)H dehydrogenase (quinone)